MPSETKTVVNAVSAREIVDISRWLPQAWPGEIEDGKLSLPEEINSGLLSRMVYVLGTVSGYFIICPDEFMSQERSPGKCVSFPIPRNHAPHVCGIGMTELTGEGCLTLPREIRNAPEFEDPDIVLIERHGFIEVWSMAAWDLAMNS
jgi:DNA-binding transcriptional regulator/RsmH inhibitor MraZ